MICFEVLRTSFVADAAFPDDERSDSPYHGRPEVAVQIPAHLAVGCQSIRHVNGYVFNDFGGAGAVMELVLNEVERPRPVGLRYGENPLIDQLVTVLLGR